MCVCVCVCVCVRMMLKIISTSVARQDGVLFCESAPRYRLVCFSVPVPSVLRGQTWH